MCGVGVVEDVGVGVTGEEIRDLDGVFEVFCAVDQSGLDTCQSRDVVNSSEVKGVGGRSESGAVGDVVVELDGAVEVGIWREGPAITNEAGGCPCGRWCDAAVCACECDVKGASGSSALAISDVVVNGDGFGGAISNGE